MNRYIFGIIVVVASVGLSGVIYQVGRVSGIVEMSAISAIRREVAGEKPVDAPVESRHIDVPVNGLDCWAIFTPKNNPKAIYPGYFKSEPNGHGGHMCTSDAARDHLRATTTPEQYADAVFERVGITR